MYHQVLLDPALGSLNGFQLVYQCVTKSYLHQFYPEKKSHLKVKMMSNHPLNIDFSSSEFIIPEVHE